MVFRKEVFVNIIEKTIDKTVLEVDKIRNFLITKQTRGEPITKEELEQLEYGLGEIIQQMQNLECLKARIDSVEKAKYSLERFLEFFQR